MNVMQWLDRKVILIFSLRHLGLPVGCLSAALLMGACSDGGTGGGTGGGSQSSSSSSSSGQGSGGGGGGLPMGQCRTDADCTGPAESCLPPGAFPGCGACMNVDNPCTGDSMCTGANEICEPAQCACGGESVCKLGCLSNMECGGVQVCEMLRCVGKPCSAASDCPANYACGQDGRCGRRTCAADGECDGLCVQGQCYDQAGTCTPPVP